LSTPWGNSDNKDDPFPKPPVTDHALLVTSVSWFWKYANKKMLVMPEFS